MFLLLNVFSDLEGYFKIELSVVLKTFQYKIFLKRTMSISYKTTSCTILKCIVSC